jgi:aminoglycoside phosphotransferase (APT) family kinase protein
MFEAMRDDDPTTIRRLLGDVRVQPLGAGLDHRVYAVGERLVARFGEGAEAEAALLEAIAARLPLPVPVPIALDAEAGCLIQPRVPGAPLLALPRAARGPFARELLAFVDALHGLDVDVAKDDTPLETWVVEAAETLTAVRDELPAHRRAAVEAALRAAVPPSANRTLIHGDLGAEHVFVDAGRITGVIDWGDAAIGDPAVDHGRLMRDLGVDLGERARMYAVCTALEDLAFGLETGDDLYRANAIAALDDLT